MPITGQPPSDTYAQTLHFFLLCAGEVRRCGRENRAAAGLHREGGGKAAAEEEVNMNGFVLSLAVLFLVSPTLGGCSTAAGAISFPRLANNAFRHAHSSVTRH